MAAFTREQLLEIREEVLSVMREEIKKHVVLTCTNNRSFMTHDIEIGLTYKGEYVSSRRFQINL